MFYLLCREYAGCCGLSPISSYLSYGKRTKWKNAKPCARIIQKTGKRLSNQRLNLPHPTVGSCNKDTIRCIVQSERRKQDESSRDWKIYCQTPQREKLTQAQLAEKLNITDRAVSKWKQEKYARFIYHVGAL